MCLYRRNTFYIIFSFITLSVIFVILGKFRTYFRLISVVINLLASRKYIGTNY